MKSPHWESNFPTEPEPTGPLPGRASTDGAALLGRAGGREVASDRLGHPSAPWNWDTLARGQLPADLPARRKWCFGAAEFPLGVPPVARYLGGPGYRPRPAVAKAIAAGIEQGLDLIEPTALRCFLPVAAAHPDGRLELIGAEAIVLSPRPAGNPRTLCSPPTQPQGTKWQSSGRTAPTAVSAAAPATAPATPLVLAAVVATLGSGLEQRSRNLAAVGELFQATLLDAVGTALIDQLNRLIDRRLDAELNPFGLFPGPRFAPGIDDFPLARQRTLWRLTAANRLGITLNSADIMEPFKSISFFRLITVIPGAKSAGKCRECTLFRCSFRAAAAQSNAGPEPDRR